MATYICIGSTTEDMDPCGWRGRLSDYEPDCPECGGMIQAIREAP